MAMSENSRKLEYQMSILKEAEEICLYQDKYGLNCEIVGRLLVSHQSRIKEVLGDRRLLNDNSGRTGNVGSGDQFDVFVFSKVYVEALKSYDLSCGCGFREYVINMIDSYVDVGLDVSEMLKFGMYKRVYRKRDSFQPFIESELSGQEYLVIKTFQENEKIKGSILSRLCASDSRYIENVVRRWLVRNGIYKSMWSKFCFEQFAKSTDESAQGAVGFGKKRRKKLELIFDVSLFYGSYDKALSNYTHLKARGRFSGYALEYIRSDMRDIVNDSLAGKMEKRDWGFNKRVNRINQEYAVRYGNPVPDDDQLYLLLMESYREELRLNPEEITAYLEGAEFSDKKNVLSKEVLKAIEKLRQGAANDFSLSDVISFVKNKWVKMSRLKFDKSLARIRKVASLQYLESAGYGSGAFVRDQNVEGADEMRSDSQNARDKMKYFSLLYIRSEKARRAIQEIAAKKSIGVCRDIVSEYHIGRRVFAFRTMLCGKEGTDETVDPIDALDVDWSGDVYERRDLLFQKPNGSVDVG